MIGALGAIGGLLGGAASIGGLMSSLFGGGSSTSGVEDAMMFQNWINLRAIDEAKQRYNTSRSDLAPYRDSGSNALLAYLDMLGIPRPENIPGSATTPTYDPTALLESTPGYQWRVKESENALDKYLASKGMSLSGAGLKAAEANRQGLASQEYDKLINRISGLTSLGENAAAMTGNLGQAATNTEVNALMNTGQQATNNAYQLAQLRNSSYNSPWGFAGYGAGKIGNALEQLLSGSNAGNVSGSYFPSPSFSWED